MMLINFECLNIENLIIQLYFMKVFMKLVAIFKLKLPKNKYLGEKFKNFWNKKYIHSK